MYKVEVEVEVDEEEKEENEDPIRTDGRSRCPPISTENRSTGEWWCRAVFQVFMVRDVTSTAGEDREDSYHRVGSYSSSLHTMYV